MAKGPYSVMTHKSGDKFFGAVYRGEEPVEVTDLFDDLTLLVNHLRRRKAMWGRAAAQKGKMEQTRRDQGEDSPWGNWPPRKFP